jgi:hypothetical protein
MDNNNDNNNNINNMNININININNDIARVPPSIKLERKYIKNEHSKIQIKELENSNIKPWCAKKLFNN